MRGELVAVVQPPSSPCNVLLLPRATSFFFPNSTHAVLDSRQMGQTPETPSRRTPSPGPPPPLLMYLSHTLSDSITTKAWLEMQITDTPLTPEITPALEALICSDLHHSNILATLRYACRPHKVRRRRSRIATVLPLSSSHCWCRCCCRYRYGEQDW